MAEVAGSRMIYVAVLWYVGRYVPLESCKLLDLFLLQVCITGLVPNLTYNWNRMMCQKKQPTGDGGLKEVWSKHLCARVGVLNF